MRVPVCQIRSTKAALVQYLVQDKNEMQDETQAHCSSTLFKPYVMPVLAGAPQCLKPTVVPCVLKGLKIDGLLDTGASENFISEKVAKSVGLKPSGYKSQISMASDELTAPVLGKVQSELELQRRKYPNVTFGVIPKLCADIVLGHNLS